METRTIELSLETAKRWYEQGGELREMALCAFSEEELVGDRLPKTWEEFCEHNKVNINVPRGHLALMQLHQLRDCYRQGWKPDWSDNCYKYGVKWNIFPRKKELMVTWRNYDPLFLSFQTEEVASEFLTNFRDLIEQAGDLI